MMLIPITFSFEDFPGPPPSRMGVNLRSWTQIIANSKHLGGTG